MKKIELATKIRREQHLQHTRVLYLRTAKGAHKSDTKRIPCQTTATSNRRKRAH